jgi:hypothetical protein
MRRLIAIGALALLVLAVVPFASGSTTVATRHVDGTVKVFEPAGNGHSDREWLARFEVRTTAGVVQFGYMHLYGISGDVAGQIHEFSVNGVDYYRTGSGAQGATLWVEECIIDPSTPCFGPGDYRVSDGGSKDTFMPQLGWTIESGNISIYTTGGQNSQ